MVLNESTISVLFTLTKRYFTVLDVAKPLPCLTKRNLNPPKSQDHAGRIMQTRLTYHCAAPTDHHHTFSEQDRQYIK